MASAKFDNEKQRFIGYYNDHQATFEGAKEVLVSLVSYLLAEEGVALCSVQGRGG